MQEQAWHDALRGVPFEEIARAWQRRDNRPLRVFLERHLTDDPLDPPGTGRLKAWRRLSQAVFTGERAPLAGLFGSADEGSPGAGRAAGTDLSWAELADRALSDLERRLDLSDADEGAALLGVFVFFESLTFWEYSSNHVPIVAIIEALAARGRSVEPVRDAAVRMADILRAQFDVESGIGQQSAGNVGRRAADVVGALRALRTELEASWPGLEAAQPQGGLRLRLAALLLEEIAYTVPYYELLATAIAPAAQAFAEGLTTRRHDVDVAEQLGKAVAASRAFEESAVGRAGVYGTEARAHRLCLEAAARVLEDEAPSLLLSEVDVVFVYPFPLPLSGLGNDVTLESLRRHFEGRAGERDDVLRELAGGRVTLDDTPQTDAWAPNLASDQLTHVGVRLLFEQDQLMLRTAEGHVFRDLDVEVRLGGLGNYYVRVRISRSTQCSDDEGVTWQSRSPEWTPHVFDQMVRRVAEVTGGEEIWFQSRADQGATVPADGTFASFVELAAQIVSDLTAYAQRLRPTGDDDPDVVTGEAGDAALSAFVVRNAHALVTVTAAVGLGPGGRRVPVETTERLLELAGHHLLFDAQRPFATGLLQWARSTGSVPESSAATVLTTSREGQARELIRCNGDTTVVFAPTSPNWQVLETVELVEFAASLNGIFARRRDWLTRWLQEDEVRSRVLGERAGSDLVEGSAWTADHRVADLAELRSVEQALNERVGRVQALLDRATEFMLSRNHHARGLLTYLCERNGVMERRDALEAVVASSSARQDVIRSRVERAADTAAQAVGEQRELRRIRSERPLQIILTVLTVLGLIDLFTWANETWRVSDNQWVWLAEVTTLVLMAGAVYVLMRRSHRSSS